MDALEGVPWAVGSVGASNANGGHHQVVLSVLKKKTKRMEVSVIHQVEAL